MATNPVGPYVPQFITVHMGPPSSYAENVTVSFPDYIKNVASSEIYPTWEPAAIRANILAIISFALNRVYNGSGTQNMAENPVEVLSEYVPELNDELRRKREEFGVK